MTESWEFSVELVDFVAQEPAIRHVRETVFVIEQEVPLAEEWDGLDPECLQALARDASGHAIGTGRLTPDRHIGRMAVMATWRGHGVGAAILVALMAAARERGWHELALNSQLQAMPFYARYGFVAEGAEFMEAGIPHRRMVARI